MSDDGLFRLLGEEEARRILKYIAPTAEMYLLRVRAVRRLRSVTTPEEREAARQWSADHPRPGKEDARLTRLRELANSRAHQCAGFGCLQTIPGDALMCFEHWVLVPEWLRERLVATRNPKASMQWPLDLVEQAIRATMTAGDVSALVSRIESSHQSELGLEEAS